MVRLHVFEMQGEVEMVFGINEAELYERLIRSMESREQFELEFPSADHA